MATARPQVNDDLLALPNTDWEYIIDNYIKNEENRIIAKMYYLDGIPQADIGAELGYSRSTIRDRLKGIIKTIEKYAKRQS